MSVVSDATDIGADSCVLAAGIPKQLLNNCPRQSSAYIGTVQANCPDGLEVVPVNRWRRECHVDNFFRDHPIDSYDEARKVYPCWTGRRTKSGVPVFIYRVCDLDKKVRIPVLDLSFILCH